MDVIVDTSRVMEQLWTLAECQCEDQINTILTDVTRQLGFEYFLYAARFVLDRGRYLDRIITNYPDTWGQNCDARWRASGGPLTGRAPQRLTPLIWETARHSDTEWKVLLEDLSDYDAVAGASFPVHSKGGDVGLLSLALGSNDAPARRFVRDNVIYGPLIANFVHDAMREIVNKVGLALRSPLTKREFECLVWIAAGKSTWETAQILNLSEHGVIHHVRNIMQKFDVTSRHQAVARAISCGLV